MNDPRPRRFAVLGDPIAHSKSPAMHAAAYRALGLPHSYEPIRARTSDLPRLVDRLRDGTFDGFNVTVPHKRTVLAYVDAVDTSAELCAAANTLVPHEGGSIVAYNTDAPALAEEIRQLAPDVRAWGDVTAVVLGTGGAARSAMVALAVELGVAHVVVRGRSMGDEAKRAELLGEMRPLLAKAGAKAELSAEPWAPSAETEKRAIVVVQGTSVGMHGAAAGEAAAEAVAWGELSPRAVALDVVYAPIETPFLHAATAHGIRATNGLGMLARQGALAFELWLGVPAPYNAMLAAIR